MVRRKSKNPLNWTIFGIRIWFILLLLLTAGMLVGYITMPGIEQSLVMMAVSDAPDGCKYARPEWATYECTFVTPGTIVMPSAEGTKEWYVADNMRTGKAPLTGGEQVKYTHFNPDDFGTPSNADVIVYMDVKGILARPVFNWRSCKIENGKFTSECMEWRNVWNPDGKLLTHTVSDIADGSGLEMEFSKGTNVLGKVAARDIKNDDIANWKVSFNPLGLVLTEYGKAMEVFGSEELGWRQGCKLLDTDVKRLVQGTTDKTAMERMDVTTTTKKKLLQHERIPFVAGAVSIPDAQRNIIRVAGSEYWCEPTYSGGILRPFVKTTTGAQGCLYYPSFIEEDSENVACCPGQIDPTDTSRVCEYKDGSFKYIQIEEVECSATIACPLTDWDIDARDSERKTIVRHECVNGKCVEKTKEVECATSAACPSDKECINWECVARGKATFFEKASAERGEDIDKSGLWGKFLDWLSKLFPNIDWETLKILAIAIVVIAFAIVFSLLTRRTRYRQSPANPVPGGITVIKM